MSMTSTEPLTKQDLIFRELHHRFYNSLQLISAMTSALSSDALKDGVKQLQHRIGFLASMHRMLAQPVVGEFGLRTACDELCLHLVRAFDREDVRMAIHIEPVPLAAEHSRAVLLMVAELVTNALKHGPLRGPSSIDVRLGRRAMGAELTVSNSLAHGAVPRCPEVARHIAQSIGGELSVVASDRFVVEVIIPAG